MLTKKQLNLLMLIHERLASEGIPPSYEEMKNAVGLKSKSGIHRLITTLEERGFLRRLPHKARALEVIRLPNTVPLSLKGRPFVPSVIEGMGAEKEEGNQNEEKVSLLHVSVMGRIAAGTPIEAIEEEDSQLPLPEELLGKGDFFALVVSGDSMIDAGIHNGDIVVINKTQDVRNGDIVVALIDNSEATLKRFRRHGESVALEAANPDYPTRIVGLQQLTIQGKLAMVIRRYS